MLDKGKMTDLLSDNLYQIAMKPRYKFNLYNRPWGKTIEDKYRQLKIGFIQTVRQFAKDSGIKWHDGDFYCFNGKIYEKVPADIVSNAFEIVIENLGIAEMTNSKQAISTFMQTIATYNSMKIRNDIIAFSNGVVDFRNKTGVPQLHPFDPIFDVIDIHPYRYDPDAKGELWKNFLREVLPRREDRHILQMFLGLGLVQTTEAYDRSPDAPRGTVELCLILLGGGANGKSVLFNVICALFGKRYMSSVDYDVLTADGEEGMRGRYPIRNAVFNWSTDSDPKKFGKKNTAMFKRIVSGEPIQYRAIGQNIMETSSSPYLIFSMNELPTPADQSRGFLRRLQFVSFDVTIPRARQDPDLAYKIIKKDLPGVFNWVMRGSKEIRRRHFQFPDSDSSMKQKILAFLPDNPLAAWELSYKVRAESIAPGELYETIPSAKCYSSYKQFCNDNNIDEELIMSPVAFGHAMTRMGFERKRRADGICYVIYGATSRDLGSHILVDMIEDDGSQYDTDDSYIIND